MSVVDALTIGSDGTGLWLAIGGRPAPAPGSGEIDHVDGATLRVDRQFAAGWAPIDIVSAHDSLWIAEGRLDDRRQGVVKDVVDRLDQDGQLLARIRVAGPVALAGGFDSVWVVSATDRSLVRIDPTSDELVGEIVLPEQPVGIATSDRSIWVLTGAANGSGSSVYGINPSTGDVDRRIEFRDGGPGTIAAQGSSVWVALSAVAPGMSRLVQLDANTGAEVRRENIIGNRDLSVADHTLWLGASDGHLQAIDLRSWTFTDVGDVGSDISGVAATPSGVWILGNGQLARWTPSP